MEVKLKMVVREVIKPSSPSPKDHLPLSFLDLTSPAFYVLIIFFYKAQDLVDMSPENISITLKNSLSKTLSRFYPLAGRIVGNSINCNDEGAIFTEAHTDLHLQDFLRNINTNSLQVFCSTNATEDSPIEWPLLGVKLTFFGSASGVAVSVSVSHRICDAASLLTFVTEWAKTTVKEKSNYTIQFAETTICPSHISSTDYNTFIETEKCVTNRFVFEPSKIIELKRKAASESVPLPTRVEAISALVLKCAGNASRSNSMVPRPILMYHAMDLRLRIPSTRDAIGNLQTPLYLKKDTESDLGICETVVAFRKAKEEANKMIQENLQGDTIGEYLLRVFGNFELEVKEDIDLYIMSSWCKKPFYEVDFGWGSPVWIGTVFDNRMKDFVWLIDTKDGDGLEAWIGLPEQDMQVFLRDQDLLAYALPNPPVLI